MIGKRTNISLLYIDIFTDDFQFVNYSKYELK